MASNILSEIVNKKQVQETETDHLIEEEGGGPGEGLTQPPFHPPPPRGPPELQGAECGVTIRSGRGRCHPVVWNAQGCQRPPDGGGEKARGDSVQCGGSRAGAAGSFYAKVSATPGRGDSCVWLTSSPRSFRKPHIWWAGGLSGLSWNKALASPPL